MKFLKRAKDHLVESEWSYAKHLSHSIKQSNRLLMIALKSYVHGFLPWMFVSNGPLGIYKIYKEIKKIHHVQKLFRTHDTTAPEKDTNV